jgi:V/A-type H+/Na+-transporting ATPase subunit I
MIVKMQKLTLLVGADHQDDALQQLRKLGVVHVQHVQPPASAELTALESELSDLRSALRIIDDADDMTENIDVENPADTVKEILSLSRKQEEIRHELTDLNETRRWFENWGAVSETTLTELKEAGVFVRLYTADKSFLERESTENQSVYLIKADKNRVHLALITTDPDERLELSEEQIPEIERDVLMSQIGQLETEMSGIQANLNELAKTRAGLRTYQTELEKELEFNRVRDGMGDAARIVYLQGFCPNESVPQIKDAADREGWAYLFDEPDDPNEVPTLIRTPKWLRMVNPIFKFMGSLPGYGESDISFWFLLFFSLFFAMLIGDAGYGAVFLLATFFAQRRLKHLPREPFWLMYVLSGATILWGAITGTWFGFEKFAQLPILNAVVINRVNSFVAGNEGFMMYLCFLIGVVHLTVARGITALKYINSRFALAQLGWMGILWGLFFVASKLVLDKPLPGFTTGALIFGVVLVTLFSSPHGKFLKGVLVSIGDLPLKVISSFSDIVSYLRLFAVGYATVIVATSFNDMVLSAGTDNIISGLFGALILLAGHALNIVLALMAVVVHGIRLNMLEFSGQLNMQWSGKEYRPFKD